MFGRDIKLYSAELEVEGLAEKILATANRTIAYTSVAKPFDLSELVQTPDLLDRVKAIATNLSQPDLYYFSSILVSTGWNKNDDVFDVSEVWAAKSTPEDKKINYEHDEKDIIGHITACYPVDVNFKVIPGSTAIDDLPDKFHIVTGGVLYSRWEDDKLAERLSKIQEEIVKGTIYVSMEALFPEFDYGIQESNGSCYVLNRNSETAFLTKFLRSYGGSGVYKDKKVGRVLRSITFSGKGIVRNPANPESITFDGNLLTDRIAKSKLIIGENKTMAAETKELIAGATPILDSKTLSEVTSLRAELAEAKQERATAKAQADAEAKARAAQEVADLKASVASKTGEVNVAQERIVKLEADLKSANDKVTASDAELKKVNDELTKIKTEARKVSRISTLVSAGHSKEVAEGLETKLSDLSDEAFAATVALIKVEASADPEDEEDDEVEGEKEAKAALKNSEKTKDAVDPAVQGKATATLDEISKGMSDLISKKYLKSTAKLHSRSK